MATSTSSRIGFRALLRPCHQNAGPRSSSHLSLTAGLANSSRSLASPLAPLTSIPIPQLLSTQAQKDAESEKKLASQTARASVTLRRFWKTVGIMEHPGPPEAGYHITLDGRPLKTPSGTKLWIPRDRKVLAMLIANEWENQGDNLKVVGLPMTSLASRATDGLIDKTVREGVVNEVLRYLDTDTTCFPSEHPSILVRLQTQHWAPLHEWYKAEHGLEIKSFNGIVISGKFTQEERTREVLRGIVASWDEWQVAALERATYATKSFLIAFALISGRLTAHEAAEASHVEVASQIELWGEVEDTHDVDYQDIRRALGSALCLLAKSG